MKSPILQFQRSLSMKLSLGILSFVMVIFIICLGFLFLRSRGLVKQEAMERASFALDNMVLRAERYLADEKNAADISAERLTDIINANKPYPNSYGKLEEAPADRGEGSMRVRIDEKPCLVFYKPLPDTKWSVTLTCPEEDIFAGYKTLSYILLPIFFVGLLLMTLICWKTIQHFIKPLDTLAQQSRLIAEGQFDKPLPRSDRVDVVGDLQNSFVSMQHSINEYITSIQRVNEETEQRNAELVEANRLAKEADQRKDTFIHEMALQIRTPLNIIAGFMQLLDKNEQITPTTKENEVEESVENMKNQAFTVKRMAQMLFEVSWMGDRRTLDTSKEVDLNDVIQESLQDFQAKPPQDMVLNYTTNLSKPHLIHTNRLYLRRLLRELLINAKKYAAEKPVNLKVEAQENIIRFTIEDHGPGIPKDMQKQVFEPFVKLDHFSEGLGLGLGLSRQYAKSLQGSLILDPDYTDGARFIVEIPNA